MAKIVPGISSPDELRRLNRNYPDRYPFLLQSTARGGALGRFDILFAFPDESIALGSDGHVSGRDAAPDVDFLDALDAWWIQEQTVCSESELPFNGGWFLYLGYELAAQIEPSLSLHEDRDLPVAFAVRCPAALIYDHEMQLGHFVAEQSGESLFAQVQSDLSRAQTTTPQAAAGALQVHEEDAAPFLTAVRRAKDYIRAGDIYQANLSRKWSATVSDSSGANSIYDALCRANPAPFAGIAHWQGTTIISSSPERLLRIENGIVSTRPIAGTRPRNNDAVIDSNLSDELIAHPKERAEHVMLIDLERNDLGRICIAGSVEVDEMMVVETYAHVHHIVSNVRGKLRPEVTPGMAIAATFPGGTITGCPKVRCMQIINELELTARGAYTGSFGYLNRDGSLDLNILIRTMVKRGNDVTFRAGAGIVADSVPESELQESRDKAEGLLRALNDG